MTRTDWPERLAAACRHAHFTDRDDKDARRARAGTAPREAAVLIGIRDIARPTLLLTRRSDALRHHPGQISFPGGSIEAGDASPAAAACREAFEEIALDRPHVEILGQLPAYATVTGFSIAPFVARIAPEATFAPDGVEAVEIIELPLASALDPAAYRRRRVEHEGRTYRIYSIDHAGHHVWGATASMLVTLARAVAGLDGRGFDVIAEATA